MKRAPKLFSAMLLATLLAAGAVTAWGVAAQLVYYKIDWDFRPPMAFGQRFFGGFTDDGQPVTGEIVPKEDSSGEKDMNSARVEFVDSAGQPLHSNDWVDDLEVPAPVGPSKPWIKRLLWTGRQTKFSEEFGQWTLVGGASPEQGAYFVITPQSGEPIGYFGMAGYRDDLPPAEDRFANLVAVRYLSNWSNYRFVLDCGSEVYLVDVENRTLQTLFDGLATPTVSNLDHVQYSAARTRTWLDFRRRPWESIAWSPGREFSGFFFRNDELLCLLTVPEGWERDGVAFNVLTKTFKLPESLRGRKFSIGPRSDGELLIVVPNEKAADGDTTTVQTFSLAADGTTSSPQEATIPAAEYEPRPVRFAALAGLASPLVLWIERAVRGDSSAFGPGVLAVVYLLSAGMALLCLRREGRYYESASERIAWPLLVFLLGVPGWIGYRYGRRWPVVEPCPACGRAVPRDRQECAACHREFPLPVLEPELANSAVGADRGGRQKMADKPRSLVGMLVRKELRESRGIVVAGFILYLLWLFSMITESDRQKPPFLADDFRFGWGVISWGLAIALAIKQATWERVRGTYLFLLHRPIDRRTIFGVKILVGLAMLQLAALVPIVIYATWAGWPGTHACPFRWWMTAPAWHIWLVLPIAYLGAFLGGLMPGHWLGTRGAPLAAASALLLWIGLGVSSRFSPGLAREYLLTGPGAVAALAISLVAAALTIYCTRYVAARRDFG